MDNATLLAVSGEHGPMRKPMPLPSEINPEGFLVSDATRPACHAGGCKRQAHHTQPGGNPA